MVLKLVFSSASEVCITFSVTVEAISDTFCEAISLYRTALSVAVLAAFVTDDVNIDQP
jgi:hypothetical protein